MDGIGCSYVVPAYQPALRYFSSVVLSVDRCFTTRIKELVQAALALSVIAGGISVLPKAYSFSHRITGGLKRLNVIVAIVGVAILFGAAVKWRHLFTYFFLSKLAGKVHRSLAQYGKHASTIEGRVCWKQDKKIGEIISPSDHINLSLPVLKLYTQDPYEMGYVHGYLLGDRIEDLVHRVIKPMVLLFQGLVQDWTGKGLVNRTAEISIAENHAKEMQGLADGIKAYAKVHGYESQITLEDVYLTHRLPDTYKAIGHRKVLGLFYPNSLGCSTAVVRRDKEMVIGRTLEWMGLELMGKAGIIREHHVGDRKIVMQTFPGFIGALTAKNSDGLVMVINELGKQMRQGNPYNLLSRDLIEHAANVQEAEKMINSPDYKPASSHHVILMDQADACNFQFYVSCRKYVKREISPFGYLVVTNHALDGEDEIIEGSQGDITSEERHKLMTEAITQEMNMKRSHSLKRIMRKALKAVNTYNTVASSIYTSELDDQGEHAFDSHYAASHLFKD